MSRRKQIKVADLESALLAYESCLLADANYLAKMADSAEFCGDHKTAEAERKMAAERMAKLMLRRASRGAP